MLQDQRINFSRVVAMFYTESYWHELRSFKLHQIFILKPFLGRFSWALHILKEQSSVSSVKQPAWRSDNRRLQKRVHSGRGVERLFWTCVKWWNRTYFFKKLYLFASFKDKSAIFHRHDGWDTTSLDPRFFFSYFNISFPTLGRVAQTLRFVIWHTIFWHTVLKFCYVIGGLLPHRHPYWCNNSVQFGFPKRPQNWQAWRKWFCTSFKANFKVFMKFLTRPIGGFIPHKNHKEICFYRFWGLRDSLHFSQFWLPISFLNFQAFLTPTCRHVVL